MNTTSLSSLMRDKRAQAAAAVGAVLGLVVFVRKGSSGGSVSTATDTTGSNGSLGGLYAGSGGGAGAAGGGAGDTAALEAYTAQLSSMSQILAGIAQGGTTQPTTATAVPPAGVAATPAAKPQSYVMQQLAKAAAQPSGTTLANDTVIALKAGVPLSPAKAGFLMRNL